MKDLSFRTLPSIAVADGATSPAPSDTTAGSWAWSSTLGQPVYWDGGAWRAMPGGGGGGLTQSQVLARISMGV